MKWKWKFLLLSVDSTLLYHFTKSLLKSKFTAKCINFVTMGISISDPSVTNMVLIADSKFSIIDLICVKSVTLMSVTIKVRILTQFFALSSIASSVVIRNFPWERFVKSDAPIGKKLKVAACKAFAFIFVDWRLVDVT